MEFVIRRLITQVTEDRIGESGPAEVPLRKVVVAAVMANPFVGGFAPDLSDAVDYSPELGDLLGAMAVSALGASAGGTAASREATRPRTNTPTSPPITRPRTSALAPKTAELSDPNRVDPRLVYGGLKPAPAEQSPVLEPNDVNLPAEPPVLVAEEEPSAMERLIAGEIDPNVSTQLKQFGYDVFAAPVLTFAPVTDVPVGPDYVIGPGDSFILTLWGRVDAQFLLQVDRNGQVVVPQVGALRVWGMKFSEMEDYLQHELSRKYSDFKMSVAMDRLRVIRVFVVGEASKPGSYTISSLATVINALVAAGGPSKSGSLRNIQLRRNGAEPMTVKMLAERGTGRIHGAQLVGDAVQYEDTYRLAYIRSPESIIVGLSEQLG